MSRSIKTKVFRTVLGVALMFGVTIGAVTVFQFYGQKQRIEQANAAYAKELTREAETQLAGLNREIAGNLTTLYGNAVNENFSSVRLTAQSLAAYIGSLYEENQPDPAPAAGQSAGQSMGQSPRDEQVGYMQGADPETQAEELAKIKGVRQYIKTLAEYNPDNQDNLDIYVVTESGMCLDGTGRSYVGEEYPELRSSDWYIGAKESGKPFWAKVFTGAATGIRKITCGVPFYDGDGTFRGVAAVDLAIDHIYDTALAVRSDQVQHALLLDGDGTVMINPDQYDLGTISREEGIYVKDGGFISFMTIPETNWTLCMVFQFELVQKTTDDISRIISDNSQAVGTLMDETVSRSIWIFLAVIAVGCVLVFFLSRRMAGELSTPINRLAKEVEVIGQGNLDYQIQDMDTGDEIGQLADSFNEMTKKLKVYVENLAAVTAEKERIGAELTVATQIQASMLPCIFPAFPDHKEFDIYATMEPAKEVGGDFYDFFMVDSDHLAVVMADVSGKGVPAALFMVIAKTLIKNHAQNGDSAVEVFNHVNRQLCENNEAGLFVTAWMGILEISTGEFIYVNAGHNPPLLRRGNGSFEYLRGRAGFVLAGIEDMAYQQTEMKLFPGDMLYLYTDGVTEATDIYNELYGDDRLLEYLNRVKDLPLSEILHGIKADIDAFVKGAPQFDDITMLMFQLNEGGYHVSDIRES